MKLVLDDDAVRMYRCPPGWAWIADAHEALALIRTGLVEEASLDHDLGNEPWNGYWVLCQIEMDLVNGRRYSVPKLLVHSLNPAGVSKMKMAIASIEGLVRSGEHGAVS